jgi:hypothetical protein
VRTLPRGRKEKPITERHKNRPRKRNGGTPIGYSGRITLTTCVMCHVDPLIGNDRDRSSYTISVVK